jgi:hypothetical protein
VEAAIHFCLEHGAEVERLLGGSRALADAPLSAEARRRDVQDKLREMGFPDSWSGKALDAVGGEGFDAALTWILANGDALHEQDQAAEAGQAPTAAASAVAAVSPRLVCTSGATVFSKDLQVSVKVSGRSEGRAGADRRDDDNGRGRRAGSRA